MDTVERYDVSNANRSCQSGEIEKKNVGTSIVTLPRGLYARGGESGVYAGLEV